MQPTVAVDLRVLDFVMRLFLNMPPNNTALTKTLEGYLDSLGYKLDSRVYTYIFTFVRSLTPCSSGRASTALRKCARVLYQHATPDNGQDRRHNFRRQGRPSSKLHRGGGRPSKHFPVGATDPHQRPTWYLDAVHYRSFLPSETTETRRDSVAGF